MITFFKKHFRPNKLILPWLLITTIFGSFAALTNSQFLNTGRDAFAASSVKLLPYCEEGDVEKKDGKDVCTSANKEESSIALCGDGLAPKTTSGCNSTQTGLLPVYDGGNCPAGLTEVYASERNQGVPLFENKSLFSFNFTVQRGVSNAYRKGKLCAIRPDFFSIVPGCAEPNPNILPRGGVFDDTKNSEYAEAFYNQIDPSTQRTACFEDCPPGFDRVVISAVLKNYCRKGAADCGTLDPNGGGLLGGVIIPNSDCSGKEYCNANFSGLCKITGSRDRGTILGIGGSSYSIDLLTDQKIRGTRPVCGVGKKPFISWTGAAHSSYKNNTLCVKNEYLTQVTYVPGSTLNSTSSKQCVSVNQVEVFFDDADISDTEMDLLCTARIFPPQFEKKTFVCPAGWLEFNTEKCYRLAQFKEVDEASFGVKFENNCEKTSLKSGEEVKCNSLFSNYLNGKITFSNDRNNEKCEIIVNEINNGTGSCNLKLTSKFYTIEEYQIKARFDTIEITKAVSKIKVSPQGCAADEVEINQVCRTALAALSKYDVPTIEYSGSFPGADSLQYLPPISSVKTAVPTTSTTIVIPKKDVNGDGKIDNKDLIDTNKDGVIDGKDTQPGDIKFDYLDGINSSSDPKTIASEKEISDALKCVKDEKDPTIVECSGQLPNGKTASDVKIKIGDEEIACNVDANGKIVCAPTKIKELETKPDQDLSFSIKTSDNLNLTETKKINFAKNTEISCEVNFEKCFDNQATQEELAQAIKCTKDESDETVVNCEGELPTGKIAEDIKIKIGDNSIVSCSVDVKGKIKCQPTKVKELGINPNQDISFAVLDKFHSKLTEVKKYNFLTGKESFCSVKDVKCINQAATKISLAQNTFVDKTCSGTDNKCLSGTGDFGNAKGYQKNAVASQGTNWVLIISLILTGSLLVGAGVYFYFKYFKKPKNI